MVAASNVALMDWTLFVVCAVVGGITYLVDEFFISAKPEPKPRPKWMDEQP